MTPTLTVVYKRQEFEVPQFMTIRAIESVNKHLQKYGDMDDFLLDYAYDAILKINYDLGFDDTEIGEWFNESNYEYDRNLVIVMATAAVHHVLDISMEI